MVKPPRDTRTPMTAERAAAPLPDDRAKEVQRAFLVQWVILLIALSVLGVFIANSLREGRDASLSLARNRLSSDTTPPAAQITPAPSPSMDTPLESAASQEADRVLDTWRDHARNEIALFVLLATVTSLLLFYHQRRWRSASRLALMHRAERQRDIDRLMLATEISGTGVWELDTEKRTLTWDDTMFHLYGMDRPETATMTYDAWQEKLLPEDRAATDAAFQSSVGRDIIDAVFRIRRNDGEICTLHAQARRCRVAGGQSDRLIGVTRDITRQQRVEQALRENKDFVVDVLDSLLEHVAVIDQQGKIVTINRAWREFSVANGGAITTSELIGANYFSVCDDAERYGCADAPIVAAAIRGVLDQKLVNFDFEYTCDSPTEQRWFNMHVTPLNGLKRGAVVLHENVTERKLAEQAIRESEERFSAFFEHAMLGMATTSLEKGWLLVNPALCSILGYPREELVTRTWAELTHPDDLAADVANFERLLDGSSDHYTMEKRFVRPNGEVVPAYIAVRAVRRSDRSIAFFAAIVEDISERKLAEDTLRSAQQLTQQFLDHLPGTAYVKDEDMRILLANKAFEKMLGLDPREMIGKTNAELFPGNFGKRLDADDRNVLSFGQSTVIAEDFEGRFFESSKFVIEGESGKRLLGGITLEVTERQKNFASQAALLRISEMGGTLPEREFLRQGLEIIERLTNSEIGFIHFVNDDQESIELVGWTAGALKGCTAVHESHYPMGTAGIWADCARSKKIAVFNDYANYCAKMGLPEGHAPLHRLISVPVIEEGKVRVILGVGNKASDYDEADCTTAQLIGNDLWRIVRRARAEKALAEKLDELIALNSRLDETNNKLLQSEKLASIGQLAAGVAHEINNPIGYVTSNLNSLAGYVDDLLAINAAYGEIEDRLGSSMPQAFKRVHQIKTNTDYDFIVTDIRHLLSESGEGLDRVRKIVQDLKDFSRAGGTGWQRVNLHSGLESTLNIVWNEIKYKAEVDREYSEDLPEIFCIPSQINQVFMNLLTNAAQAIEGHGNIVLRSGCNDTMVWVEVQDSGSGIAQEDLERIFEPFYTTKPVGQGTGLGLSLSWGIIQRHHGRIEVDSEQGKGTRFRILLPINQPEQHSVMEANVEITP